MSRRNGGDSVKNETAGPIFTESPPFLSAIAFISRKHSSLFCILFTFKKEVQWLSGRVLDLGPRGRGFEPHRRHCIVILEQETLVQPRKTRPCLTERLLMGRKESNQTSKIYLPVLFIMVKKRKSHF